MSGYLGLSLGGLDRLIGLPAPLIVGDLVLQGHEVPTRISIGGLQTVKVHKLPGGRRIIDAMGADPGAISWHGLFVGPTAATRARTFDVMRQQGTPYALSFGDYTFTIVIVQYEYDYRDRGAVISYRVRAEIVPDPLDHTGTLSSLASLSCEDLQTAISLLQTGAVAANTYGGMLSRSNAARATTVLSMLTSIGNSLEDASNSISATAGGAVIPADLQNSLQVSGVTTQNAIAFAGAGVLDPGSAATAFASASSLAAATSQAASLAALVQTGGYINRVCANATAANGQTPSPLIHA